MFVDIYVFSDFPNQNLIDLNVQYFIIGVSLMYEVIKSIFTIDMKKDAPQSDESLNYLK